MSDQVGQFVPFLDLNDFPGADQLNRVADSSSPPIFLPTSIIFGGETVSTVYVCQTVIVKFVLLSV